MKRKRGLFQIFFLFLLPSSLVALLLRWDRNNLHNNNKNSPKTSLIGAFLHLSEYLKSKTGYLHRNYCGSNDPLQINHPFSITSNNRPPQSFQELKVAKVALQSEPPSKSYCKRKLIPPLDQPSTTPTHHQHRSSHSL